MNNPHRIVTAILFYFYFAVQTEFYFILPTSPRRRGVRSFVNELDFFIVYPILNKIKTEQDLSALEQVQ